MMNVRVEVARRDESDDADYIISIVDGKDDVTVYVPVNEASFRQLVNGWQAALSGVATPKKPDLVIAGRLPA